MGGGNTKGVGGESRSIYILYITYTELKKKKKESHLVMKLAQQMTALGKTAQ